MKLRLLFCATGLLLSRPAQAFEYPTLQHHPDRPLCEQDLSTLRLPRLRAAWMMPEGFEERGLRPGLTHVRKEICRCLPRWRRQQPPEVRVLLHIKPNAGEVTVEYYIEPPWNRAQYRMLQCLGEPTLNVEPMPYYSDIITETGRAEEVFPYFILVDLGSGVRRPFWGR